VGDRLVYLLRVGLGISESELGGGRA
jgi:hypothetical protein